MDLDNATVAIGATVAVLGVVGLAWTAIVSTSRLDRARATIRRLRSTDPVELAVIRRKLAGLRYAALELTELVDGAQRVPRAPDATAGPPRIERGGHMSTAPMPTLSDLPGRLRSHHGPS